MTACMGTWRTWSGLPDSFVINFDFGIPIARDLADCLTRFGVLGGGKNLSGDVTKRVGFTEEEGVSLEL